MPNVTIHLLLSTRVLDHWRGGATAPFSAADGAVADAFLLGAVAPDIGYFPPTDRLLSELFHLVRSGDLARRLVETAETDAQRAYAWGWVTHLLVDLAVHPLINRAASEIVAAGPRPAVDPDREVTTAHMRVEYGLDAEFSRRYRAVGELNLRSPSMGPQMVQLSTVVDQIYGLAVEPEALATAHRRALRVARAGLALNRVFTAQLRTEPVYRLVRGLCSAVAPPRWYLPRAFNGSPLMHAIFSPIPPPGWLVNEVESVVRGFALRAQQHYEAGLTGLENYNLMLGEPDGATPNYPATVQVLQKLALRVGTASGDPDKRK